MTESNETILYAEDDPGIYTTNKGLIGKLRRMQVKEIKKDIGGSWFDLEGCKIVLEMPKQRGRGLKRLEIT